MAEFNDKCELMEQVKAKVAKEKATELRESWNMRSKFDQLRAAMEREKRNLANQDLLSSASGK